MEEEKPLYLYSSKEINDILKPAATDGTATGKAAAWFGQRAYEDSVRQAAKDGSFDKAIEQGLITKAEAKKRIKALPF